MRAGFVALAAVLLLTPVAVWFSGALGHAPVAPTSRASPARPAPDPTFTSVEAYVEAVSSPGKTSREREEFLAAAEGRSVSWVGYVKTISGRNTKYLELGAFKDKVYTSVTCTLDRSWEPALQALRHNEKVRVDGVLRSKRGGYGYVEADRVQRVSE